MIDSLCGRWGLVAFPTTNFKPSVLNSLENNLQKLYFWFWMSPFMTYIGSQKYKLLEAERQQLNSFKLGA